MLVLNVNYYKFYFLYDFQDIVSCYQYLEDKFFELFRAIVVHLVIIL